MRHRCIMVALVVPSRLPSRFGARVHVFQNDGNPQAAFGSRQFDRVVTTYVLDLLPPDERQAFLEAARESLLPDGMLCAASITPGPSFPSSTVSCVWSTLNRLSPLLTGGCRPIILTEMLTPDVWTIRHASTIVSYGVVSSVVVATPTTSAAPIRG